MPNPEKKLDTISPEFEQALKKRVDQMRNSAKIAEGRALLEKMPGRNLSNQVYKLESLLIATQNLLGEIMATLLLDPNHEYLVDYEDRWKPLIDGWKRRCDQLGIFEEEER
jgi:hypothetical protein